MKLHSILIAALFSGHSCASEQPMLIQQYPSKVNSKPTSTLASEFHDWSQPFSVDLRDFSVGFEQDSTQKAAVILSFFSSEVYVSSTFHPLCTADTPKDVDMLGLTFRCAIAEHVKELRLSPRGEMSPKAGMFLPFFSNSIARYMY